LFFWLPFWVFFNLCAVYIDSNIDTHALYNAVRSVFGTGFANFFSQADENGLRHILGETIAHTGYIIMIFQVLVSRIFERFKAIPTFLFGLVVIILGFVVMAYSNIGAPAFIFLGIFLFAVGEMICSPRIQEYIIWIAPKEKAGLYMGTNFLALGIGASLSGVTYTSLSGLYNRIGHPEYIWLTVAGHMLLGLLLMFIFTKTLGEFKEQDE
jgi:MFS family permease